MARVEALAYRDAVRVGLAALRGGGQVYRQTYRVLQDLALRHVHDPEIKQGVLDLLCELARRLVEDPAPGQARSGSPGRGDDQATDQATDRAPAAARVQLGRGALDGLIVSPTFDEQGSLTGLLLTVDTLPGIRLVVDTGAARKIRDALATALGAPAQTFDRLVAELQELRAWKESREAADAEASERD